MKFVSQLYDSHRENLLVNNITKKNLMINNMTNKKGII